MERLFPPSCLPGILSCNIHWGELESYYRYGGVIPTFAMTWHAKKIEGVVALALEKAEVGFQHLTAIAVTNRPGLKGPLIVGTDYAK